tara:strand:- start:418 stop:561 length:144 start_codon:yes stop_codon:yes gene_type:complete
MTIYCIDCNHGPLSFDGPEEEYEPDPNTGEPRCFECDLVAVTDRWEK